MKIINIKINQYKSIKNFSIDEVDSVNILIGPNNSGKSNLLDAVESLFLPENREIFYNDSKADYEIYVSLNISDKQYFKTESDTLKAKRLGNIKQYYIENQEITDLNLVNNFFSSRFVRFNNKLLLNLEKIREDYSSLKFNHVVEFKRLIRFFNLFFPDIAEIISLEQSNEETNSLQTKLKKGDKVVEFARLGSGVRRIFVIMLYHFHPEYNIILLNEPETKLHPALTGKLRDFILSANTINQTFITTHSPIFITPNNIKNVFRVSKNRSHITQFNSFSKHDHINTNRLVQEFDVDNLQIFFADQVILVEGVSDKILLKGLIKKYYKGKKEIKVVSVSGKSNIGIYMKLMNIFKIEYMVLLDRDAISGSPIKEIQKHLPTRRSSHMNRIEILRKHRIFVLPNGTIEKNYPRKFQKKDTKPLNALYALSQITDADYNSSVMKHLKYFISQI